MQKLNQEQLKKIEGGSATAGFIVAGLLTISVIVAGIFDGLVRPLSCHE